MIAQCTIQMMGLRRSRVRVARKPAGLRLNVAGLGGLALTVGLWAGICGAASALIGA